MSKSKYNLWLLMALILALSVTVASPASAETFTFYGGADITELNITNYQDMASRRFYSSYPDGGVDDVYVNMGMSGGARIRGLLRFDLSSLAEYGWTASGDATLRAKIRGVAAPLDNTDHFDIHEIRSTNAGWVEACNRGPGGGWGDPVVGLSPSWNKFSQTPSREWYDATGPGSGPYPGLGAIGDGYGARIAELNKVSYTDGDHVTWTIPKAVIQSMIDAGSNHPGFLLRMRSETSGRGSLAFYRRTNVDGPSLKVTVVPEPSTLAMVLGLGACLVFGCWRRWRR